MTIDNGAGFRRVVAAAIGGKGLLFALALAAAGLQGCITDDAAPGGVGTEPPSAELDAAAKTASASQAGANSLYLGDGCRLYVIVADAGSKARGQAYISCEKKQKEMHVSIDLRRLKADGFTADINKKSQKCKNVYWCGTGNIYINDPSGTQRFISHGYNWGTSGRWNVLTDVADF